MRMSTLVLGICLALRGRPGMMVRMSEEEDELQIQGPLGVCTYHSLPWLYHLPQRVELDWLDLAGGSRCEMNLGSKASSISSEEGAYDSSVASSGIGVRNPTAQKDPFDSGLAPKAQKDPFDSGPGHSVDNVLQLSRAPSTTVADLEGVHGLVLWAPGHHLFLSWPQACPGNWCSEGGRWLWIGRKVWLF